MPTLTRDDVVALNREAITQSGGTFAGTENLENASALDYILEEVWTVRFGVDRYPSIAEKAAAIGFHIITRHVFHDGCKRTGLQACGAFLLINGYDFNFEPIEETIRFTLQTADSSSGQTLEEFTAWVVSRSTPITTEEPQ